MNVWCTVDCNHILYEYYTLACPIIRQRCLTNHVWPIRCGAWVAPKSRLVVRSGCDPPSATTTPARPDPPLVRDHRRVPSLHGRSHPRPPGVYHLAGHQSVPASLRHSTATDPFATLTTSRSFPLALSSSQYDLHGMLDDPKPLPVGPSRKRLPKPMRRVYVVANPNEEGAGASTPQPYTPPPLLNTPSQYQDRPAQSPPHPSPINTDILKQKYQTRSNPSDRTLSSPSTPTSSPALESTPPPSTPGQKSIPSIDLAQGSDRDTSQNALISRTDNFVKKITAPFTHARRKSSGNNAPPMTGNVRAVYYDPLR